MHIWSSGSHGLVKYCPWRENQTMRRITVLWASKNGETVGHVPFNHAPIISAFLRRSSNKGFVEVTGAKVNQGAGFGLEIPCRYQFFWI